MPSKRGFYIKKATSMGFCSGVRRAITILEKNTKVLGPLQTLGPAVHNRQVLEKLADKGATVASELDQVTLSTVAIPSHGASPAILEEIARKGLRMVDTTCPIVKRAQMAAKNLARNGYFVIIFGDAHHPEVKALLGWAGTKSLATTDIKFLGQIEKGAKKIGILSQTTQNTDRFLQFINELMKIFRDRFSEIRIINTICGTTHKHQSAAAALSRKVDLMLVIGGKDSSNTKRLAEICQAEGVDTYHIETAEELDALWLRGKRRVGVTAGASTPDSSIEEVVNKLKELLERSNND